MDHNDPVWNRGMRLLHWLIAALILAQAGIGLYMVELPRTPAVIPTYNLHKSLGLTILLLAVARLAWRLLYGRPRHLPMPGWQTTMARLTHVALYLLLFAMPLSGWLMDSASGLRALHWWGLVEVPKLVGPNPALADRAESTHMVLFWVLVAVTVLHVAGAIKHHFIDRDDTLRRMLPLARRSPPE